MSSPLHKSDEYLRPLERAARAYCTMLGHDPDEEVPTPHPDGLVFPYSRPAWCFAAEKLLDLQRMLVALRQGAAPPDGSGVSVKH